MGFAFKAPDARQMTPPSLPPQVQPPSPQALLGNAAVLEQAQPAPSVLGARAAEASAQATSSIGATLGPTLDQAARQGPGKLAKPPKKKGGGGKAPPAAASPDADRLVAGVRGDIESKAAELRGQADALRSRGMVAEASALQRASDGSLSCVQASHANAAESQAELLINVLTQLYQVLCEMIEWVKTNGDRILTMVEGFIGAVAAIGNGMIQASALIVEGQLARALPLIVGFLGTMAGLGGVGDKVGDAVDSTADAVGSAVGGAVDAVTGLFG